jgi:predicted MFS family arabinose efflux permease
MSMLSLQPAGSSDSLATLLSRHSPGKSGLGPLPPLRPATPQPQTAACGWCTTAFAIAQAVAAYGFSCLFARSSGSYPLLFALAALALLLALALDLLYGRQVVGRQADGQQAV